MMGVGEIIVLFKVFGVLPTASRGACRGVLIMDLNGVGFIAAGVVDAFVTIFFFTGVELLIAGVEFVIVTSLTMAEVVFAIS